MPLAGREGGSVPDEDVMMLTGTTDDLWLGVCHRVSGER